MDGKIENKNITYNVRNVPLDGSPVRGKNTRNDLQMSVVSSDSEEYMMRSMPSNGRPNVNLNKRNGQVNDFARAIYLQNQDYQSDGSEDEQSRFNSDDDVAQDRYYPENRVENDYDEDGEFDVRYNDTGSHRRSHRQHHEQNCHKNKTEHGRTRSKSSSNIDPHSNTGVMTIADGYCKKLQKTYRPNKDEKVSSVVKKGVGAAIMAQVLCKEYSENFKMFECVGKNGDVGRIDSIIASLLSYADSNNKKMSGNFRDIMKYSQKDRSKLKNVVSGEQFINACIVGDARRLINYVNSQNGFNSDSLSIKECKLTSKSGKSLDQISKFLEGEAKKVLSIINESEKSFDSKKKGSFYKMVSGKYFGNNGNNGNSVKNNNRGHSHQNKPSAQAQSQPKDNDLPGYMEF